MERKRKINMYEQIHLFTRASQFKQNLRRIWRREIQIEIAPKQVYYVEIIYTAFEYPKKKKTEKNSSNSTICLICLKRKEIHFHIFNIKIFKIKKIRKNISNYSREH